MKRFARMLPLSLLFSVLLSHGLGASDVIETYELDQTQVESSLMSVCNGGWYPFTVTRALRALPPDQRGDAVRALGGFAKAYVQSDAFKKAYAEAFKKSKPKRGFGLPSLDPVAMAQRAAEKSADKAVDKALGNVEQDRSLDKNPDVTLRKRLLEFVAIAESVDFEAPTEGSGSSRRFTREEHETKSSVWKMCFRAGPEATGAAVAFAKEWAAELASAK